MEEIFTIIKIFPQTGVTRVARFCMSEAGYYIVIGIGETHQSFINLIVSTTVVSGEIISWKLGSQEISNFIPPWSEVSLTIARHLQPTQAISTLPSEATYAISSGI